LTTLFVTASGVFSELQAALNAICRTKPRAGTISRVVRARLASLGSVMTLGFLLLVSLVVSIALSAFGPWLDGIFPDAEVLVRAVSFLVSLGLIAFLFGLIYKILPDTSPAWRDVTAEAVATAVLFNAGKFLIGLYLGSSSVTSSFGAAGALALLLLWIYYSFLIGLNLPARGRILCMGGDRIPQRQIMQRILRRSQPPQVPMGKNWKL
jgi:membrane protein